MSELKMAYQAFADNPSDAELQQKYETLLAAEIEHFQNLDRNPGLATEDDEQDLRAFAEFITDTTSDYYYDNALAETRSEILRKSRSK